MTNRAPHDHADEVEVIEDGSSALPTDLRHPAALSTRIPNLLHLLLLLTLTFLALLFSESFLLAAAHPHPILLTLQNQRLQLIASALTYILALLAAWFTFPVLWHRPFLIGLHWNSKKARPTLALFGLLLGFATQALTSLLPIPKNLPIDTVLHAPNVIWFLALFGTLVAPLFEETLFRGFLLPALAIAIDWLRLPRSLDALATWRASESFSRPALIASSALTSLLFALIHAPQLGYTWAAVSVLFAVSLILCVVRIRTQSVAASTLIHACYNLSVFLTLFVTSSGFRHLDRV